MKEPSDSAELWYEEWREDPTIADQHPADSGGKEPMCRDKFCPRPHNGLLEHIDTSLPKPPQGELEAQIKAVFPAIDPGDPAYDDVLALIAQREHEAYLRGLEDAIAALGEKLKSNSKKVHQVYVGTDVSNWDGMVPVSTDIESYNQALVEAKGAIWKLKESK